MHKILTIKNAPIIELSDFIKLRNRIPRLILASGGFDPLHAGHISYLLESKNLGGELAVVVNGDGFLKNKKGRSFLPLSERAKIVSSLKCVDFVIPFEDPVDMTVSYPIRAIKPDIFTNGGDRKDMQTIPEWHVCLELGIALVTNIDKKGYITSSSDYLEQWVRSSKEQSKPDVV